MGSHFSGRHSPRSRMERRSYTLWASCGHVTNRFDPGGGHHWEPNASRIMESDCENCLSDPVARMQSPPLRTVTENPDLEVELRLLRIKFIFMQLGELQSQQSLEFHQIRQVERDPRLMVDPTIRTWIDQKREALERHIELERRISEDLASLTTHGGGSQLHFIQLEGGDTSMDYLLNAMADSLYRMRHGGLPPPPPCCSPRGLRTEALKSILISVPIESLTEENLKCSVCLETMGEVSKDCEAELPIHLPLCCKHPCGNRCLTEWLQENTTCPICRREYVPEITSALTRVRGEHGLHHAY